MVIVQTRELERGRALLSGSGLNPDLLSTNGNRAQDAANVVPSVLRHGGISPRMLILSIGVSLALGLLGGPRWGITLFLLCILISFLHSKHRATLRAQSFERDYPALLLALASAVRTGLDPLMALLSTSDLFEDKSVMREELRRVKAALERGDSEEQAIHQFGCSVTHPDLQLFRTAFVLARREGASLSECLRRLVKVTRNRQSFRRKVKAAVALQKLSAIGIGGCAVAIGIIQGVSNPQAMEIALAHPTGSKLLMAGVLIILAGIAWMLRISGSYK